METSESPSLPECPVCLQSYNGSDTVPRVLPCGHTACETCLRHLPQKFPQTIRCPGCTQLVKFPSIQGPSSLPKNIDLLRLCVSTGDHGETSNGVEMPSNSKEQNTQKQLLPELWSEELYATWKDWVLPTGTVSVRDGGKAIIVGSIHSGSLSRWHRCMGGNQAVTLVPVFSLASGSEKGFRFSYTAEIMNCLNKMGEDIINDLSLVLTSTLGQHRVCEIYGLWGDIEAGICYLVSKKLRRQVFENSSNLPNGFVGFNEDGMVKDAVSGFAMVALDICEIVISLHREKMIIGGFSLSCIDVDGFSHACVDLLEILLSGREVSAAVTECASGKKIVDNKDIGVIFLKLLHNGIFVSPEVIFAFLKKKNITIGDNVSTSSTIGYSSDVWTVGCVLVWLLIGTAFTEETWKTSDEENVDYSNMYLKWLENVCSLLETKLGSEFVKLRNILCECLSLDQRSRPLLTDVWKCIRKLLTTHYFGNLENEDVTDQGAGGHCLLLGKLCQIEPEVSDPSKEDLLHEMGSESDDPAGEGGHDFVKNFSQEKVKCKELGVHLDCVTALAIGGEFLFSASYDKTVQVWSLQDFSHVHTFRGHENKITAVAYVDGEQPLCVTGDGGGEIFVWAICSPFGNEPLKKWHEQKDWRYSGIHALVYSADNGNLYTGSGDKLIKAWSLQDCTLICSSMEGHRSVVSSLRVHNGVLYSGSWDGTIRLWSLSDHSPLTVFGEDVPGKAAASVLSITADRDLLVTAHENGSIKVWKNDTDMRSAQVHSGAIFSLAVEGKWLFSGGWDKTINIQEFSGDEHHIDVTSVGSIPCGSVITSLLSWNGKLFVGSADRSVKVYYYTG